MEPSPSPSQAPTFPKPLGTVETDAFCEQCGFNLHTQPVWRDERLGILVCRCPECGGHQAAGTLTTVGYSWLSRLALAGMFVWVTLVFSLLVGGFVGFVGFHVFHHETLTYVREEDGSGRGVSYGIDSQGTRYVILSDGTTRPAMSNLVYVRRFKPWVPVFGMEQDRQPLYSSAGARTQYVVGLAFFLFGIFLYAVVFAGIFWHWRRGRQYLWLLSPVVAGVLFYLLSTSDRGSPNDVWIYGGVAVWSTLLAILAMALGLWMGRPVARTLLRMFVPPRARQVFAFLWIRDGLILKPLPAREDPS